MSQLPPFTIHDLLNKTEVEVIEEISVEDAKKIYPDQFERYERPADYSLIAQIPGAMEELLEAYVPIIKSQTIESASCNHRDTMRIKFKSGAIYEYTPITEILWLQFLGSKSKGQFFDQYIKKDTKIKATKVKE